MRIYLMTDLEGVSGVMNFHDWCTPDSRYYEVAKKLLTHEVNAAVRGFIEGGATEIVVADGHGAGAIDVRLLDSRVELERGWPHGYPFGVNNTYDCMAWVGQHARAGAEYAHLAHTGGFDILDFKVNQKSMGEFGLLAACAGCVGVRSIFGSGDLAFTKEALDLVPGVVTVSVKRGLTPGAGDELSGEDYSRRNEAATHIPPARARALIEDAAQRAARRAKSEDFGLVKIAPPFERLVSWRKTDDSPARSTTASHPDNLVELLNML
jgi:D-amino peptidase